MTPQQASFRRKIIYLVLIVVLMVPLIWLGQPSSRGGRGEKPSPGGRLAQLRQQAGLAQTDIGEIDPASETIKLATLGMRGVAANILWTQANTYKMKKDWTNFRAALEQITKVQPNFISVWRFQAWNLSYNISVEFDDFRDRYYWVIEGINFLKKGVRYNDREPRLVSDLGWFISQKIGRADERKQFRYLFKRDDKFHGTRPVAERDNWLVGRESYLKAEEMVDTQGLKMQGKSPVIFRSDAPMCLINYAEALEKDGTFGEVAQRAWRRAAESWKEYGNVDIPTSYGTLIRLNDEESLKKLAQQKTEQLDAIEPGLRQKLIDQRHAKLSEASRAALAKKRAEDEWANMGYEERLARAGEEPPELLTTEERELAAEAEKAVEVTPEDVAKEIRGARRKEADKLADEIADAKSKADIINRYRDIVNFEYWRRRVQFESTPEAVKAHELIYQGKQAYNDSDQDTARRKFEEGLAMWRKVLDSHEPIGDEPSLVDDATTGEDLVRVVHQYDRVLAQLDLPRPKPFILQDVLDRHEADVRD